MEKIYSWNFSWDKWRWPMWYVIAISIVIWIVIWWFLTKQYILSLLIILISWISFFVENNSEENINVEINQLWIRVNNNFYDFPKIDSFSIVYDWWNATILRLALVKKWLKFIDLNIDNNIAVELKWILPNYIKENDKYEISFIDRLVKLLKL